jgi:hypothetical protein
MWTCGSRMRRGGRVSALAAARREANARARYCRRCAIPESTSGATDADSPSEYTYPSPSLLLLLPPCCRGDPCSSSFSSCSSLLRSLRGSCWPSSLWRPPISSAGCTQNERERERDRPVAAGGRPWRGAMSRWRHRRSTARARLGRQSAPGTWTTALPRQSRATAVTMRGSGGGGRWGDGGVRTGRRGSAPWSATRACT